MRAKESSRGTKKVALYTRVSTDDQARQGFSLPAQMKRLRAFCVAHRWQVADTYVDDGYSGRDIRRPAYTRMMEERERWDAIVVLKMDRIHRNSRNFMGFMDGLRKYGKDFVSATESLDTSTAMGRFVMDIIQRIAQLESEQTGERVYIGMHEAAESRRFLGMSDPFGFKYDARTVNLRIVPKEAKVVREIYGLYHLQRQSMQAIADGLNARRVPTKHGKTWSKRQIHRVLRSGLYHGVRRWEDVLIEGAHDPIIAPDFPVRRRRRRSIRRRDS